MYLSAPISSRGQFPSLMESMGLVEGTAVEIGTHRGDYADALLRQFPISMSLVCIDPWRNSREYEEQAKFLPHGGGNREDDYRTAGKLLSHYNAQTSAHVRVAMMRMTSDEAVEAFDDDSLSFVYIDGDHSFKAVHTDLFQWYPKIKPGGIIAGHDWMCPGAYGTAEDWGRFIQPAVYTFSRHHSLDVYLIVEECGQPWSFYCVKPISQKEERL